MLVVMVIVAGNVHAVEQSASDASVAAARLAMAFHNASKQVLPAIITLETQSGPRKTIQWAMYENPDRRRHYAACLNLNCGSCNLDYAHDGTGTGLVIDRRGFVLTCYHVIASAHTIIARMPDGRRLAATTIGSDPSSDLAVLQLADADALPEIHFGNSDDLRIGDWVVCVANPYGLGPSASAGIVSATDRELPDNPHTRLIQTDAATNPGSSGGALVNLRGDVIGINEGAFGANEGFEGIGFAIPINFAARIARQLIEHGQIPRARLGCTAESLSPEVAKHFGLPCSNGLIVTDVSPASCAKTAGIEVGDLLTHFSNTPIRDGYHLQDLLERAAGSRQAVTILRKGQTKTLQLKMPEAAAPTHERQMETKACEESSGYCDVLLGVTIMDLSRTLSEQLGYKGDPEGVLVTQVEPGNIASHSGICAGLLILRIKDQQIRNVADYRAAMTKPTLERGAVILISSPEKKHFVLIRD